MANHRRRVSEGCVSSTPALRDEQRALERAFGLV
jgi:hypothetical protein